MRQFPALWNWRLPSSGDTGPAGWAVASQLFTNSEGASMATDSDWNGRRWITKKVRRKLAWHEHKGVAFYDRERMRQPLQPIVHPGSFDGYSAPPSWAEIPGSWGEWATVPAGYFHNGDSVADGATLDALDDPPTTQTADYTLERCHVDTTYQRREWRNGEWTTIRQPAMYRWELTFTDGAVFRFVSRSIAEEALSELLKIRKAKHARPKYVKHLAENNCVFFNDRKLRTLPADTLPAELPISNVLTETAA
jgi:hypothetical protein